MLGTSGGVTVNLLRPKPPYVWPEPRARERMAEYEYDPPFGELAYSAAAVFGIVSAPTAKGVGVLEAWLVNNATLNARLIVMVYPACSTRQADISYLLELAERIADRLIIHICALERVTDRGSNALCFVPAPTSDVVHMIIGPSEDLGMEPRQEGHINLVLRADPPLIEAFKRHFDWLWANSHELTAGRAALIPHLVLPEGTEQGERLWREYMNSLVVTPISEDRQPAVAHVDPDTGDVTLKSVDGQDLAAPTEEVGLKKLDSLAERVARLYEKGVLVSVDKLSRIPPLETRLDPRIFGDSAELRQGNVTRKVSVQVTVIDKQTLKDIEKCRQGLRGLLTRFTFGLAENMRWMPHAAQELFNKELKGVNEKGQALIASLLNGDLDAFMRARHGQLIQDINEMHTQLGRPGKLTEDVITKVEEDLKGRLIKAQSADFMPKLSFSRLSFARIDNSSSSPWGQAFSFLSDVATLPRKALTDPFFLRGLKAQKKDLMATMNVADDAVCRNPGALDTEDRCKAELDLLSEIEKASLESRDRCELVCMILDGAPVELVDEEMKKRESV
jgi:hypothetical protein